MVVSHEVAGGSDSKILYSQMVSVQSVFSSHMVPLIYNFTFTCTYMHGIMRYLVCKIHSWSWKILIHEMSRGIFTTRVMAFPLYVTFSQDMGFLYNKLWHLHAT